MSNLKFSKGKFSKFISSKGFYVAVAVCLVGAGVATWMAVDRTITGIEDGNNQLIESENQWNDYPELERAETKQSGVDRPAASRPSTPPSSSSSSSSSQEQSAVQQDSAEQSELPVASQILAYSLPIKSEITGSFSGGELVKNTTLNDWRTHDGIDISAGVGSEVMAAADGTVTDIKADPLWGTVVVIDHPDGLQSVYCGLNSAVTCRVGDSVHGKQVIGKLDGVPCEITEPSHLHFGIKSEGKWIDPVSVLQKELVN